MPKHIAFYISNKENKNELINGIVSGKLLVHLVGLNHALFSEVALNKFIEEETRHGKYYITTQTNNSLKNSSQGERKKALLNYIVSQNPEYIIVDNVFDSLDTQAQKDIANTLTQLSCQIPIVQIVNR
ncbi:hypothetical protein [uncultured Algibacter sp.]|uniref:hypothetical protein n=1 Tax=uncultured Algibacter sp. TaxID=298659 RepID=UPI00262AC926|nr:hypothetical protein [uncultured Algibacter sp.]